MTASRILTCFAIACWLQLDAIPSESAQPYESLHLVVTLKNCGYEVETLSRGALACIVNAVSVYLDILWIIALQSSHEVHSHSGSQVWVLPIGLAASTPSWVSEDVYVWAKAVKSTAIRSTA